jgi:hypothetical protein
VEVPPTIVVSAEYNPPKLRGRAVADRRGDGRREGFLLLPLVSEMRRLVFPIVTLLAVVSCAPSSGAGTTAVPQGVISSAELITPEDMRARISFLASDAMGGRDTPSPGLEAAAAYLVREYESMGLQPAGEEGTFLQRYPFQPRRGNLTPNTGMEASEPPNVVAVIRGSDPELSGEYVVLSAHLDHVGFGPAIAGDSIYNGADDNASGTSALLEVAQAFASLTERPRRSIIFLHVSGEEHGLLGSRYYSDNPTVPIEDIIADINVDMIGRNSPDSIVVIGKEYSSLGDVVNDVGDQHPELGLTVSDDIWPEEGFFFRSDHFNFARLDIPCLFFFAGTHEDYHEPSDQAEKIDANKAARVARLIFYTVYEVANAPGEPRWDPAGLEAVRAMTR